MKFLVLVGGSLTEARTLLPVIRFLAAVPDVRVEVLLTLHLWGDPRTRATARALKDAGVDFREVRFPGGLPVASWLDRLAPDCIVACNDNLVMNRLFLDRGNARNIPFCLIDEAPSAGLLGPVNTTVRGVGWVLRNLRSVAFLASVLAANGEWRELCLRVGRTLGGRSLRMRGYGFGPVALSCVFSEFDRDYLRANGALAREILVTGLPGIPVHVNPDPARTKPYDYLLLSAGEGMFIMSRDRQIAMFQAIAGAIRDRHPGARILFKPHPLEDAEVTRALAAGMDVARDLDQAFDAAALAIGSLTTSLFQALLAGLPILSYAPDGFRWPDLFILRECRDRGLLATGPESLRALLDDRDRIEGECREFARLWTDRLESSAEVIGKRLLEMGN